MLVLVADPEMCRKRLEMPLSLVHQVYFGPVLKLLPITIYQIEMDTK